MQGGCKADARRMQRRMQRRSDGAWLDAGRNGGGFIWVRAGARNVRVCVRVCACACVCVCVRACACVRVNSGHDAAPHRRPAPASNPWQTCRFWLHVVIRYVSLLATCRFYIHAAFGYVSLLCTCRFWLPVAFGYMLATCGYAVDNLWITLWTSCG